MAIYHLNARHVQKSKGHSARAKFDYITRHGKYARQEDKCLHRESGNMPMWAKDNPREFWKTADEYERANGSLGKEVELALPSELTRDQQVELTRAFAQGVTRGKHPYTFAVHEGKGVNPHAHVFLSERTVDGIERPKEQFFRRANSQSPERGGAMKDRTFQGKAWLEATREGWAVLSNRALEQAGHEARIDHRSYEAQGILKVPEQKIGVRTLAMERRGLRTERGSRILERSKEIEGLDQQRHDLKQDIEAYAAKEAQRERSRGWGLGS